MKKSFEELCFNNEQVKSNYVVNFGWLTACDPDTTEFMDLYAEAEKYAVENQLDVVAYNNAATIVINSGFSGECNILYKGDPFATIEEFDL